MVLFMFCHLSIKIAKYFEALYISCSVIESEPGAVKEQRTVRMTKKDQKSFIYRILWEAKVGEFSTCFKKAVA